MDLVERNDHFSALMQERIANIQNIVSGLGQQAQPHHCVLFEAEDEGDVSGGQNLQTRHVCRDEGCENSVTTYTIGQNNIDNNTGYTLLSPDVSRPNPRKRNIKSELMPIYVIVAALAILAYPFAPFVPGYHI